MNDVQRQTMLLVDSLSFCGRKAKEEYSQLCRERNIKDHCFINEYTEEHLKAAKEICDRWHTTSKFKVGDKVYVVPLTITTMETCIRATVTEVSNKGYFLRAFESDLPGIYMFNIWDKDLEPRTNKKQKPTPKELLV